MKLFLPPLTGHLASGYCRSCLPARLFVRACGFQGFIHASAKKATLKLASLMSCMPVAVSVGGDSAVGNATFHLIGRADDAFASYVCRTGDVHLPPGTGAFLLHLIYSGRVDKTAQARNIMRPSGRPLKQDFAGDIQGMIATSPLGSPLPWFGEP